MNEGMIEGCIGGVNHPTPTRPTKEKLRAKEDAELQTKTVRALNIAVQAMSQAKVHIKNDNDALNMSSRLKVTLAAAILAKMK